MIERLKVILDSPTAVIPGHIIKVDDDVERPVAVVSATNGAAGPKPGRDMAIALVDRYNAHEQLIAALRELRNATSGIEGFTLSVAQDKADEILASCEVTA